MCTPDHKLKGTLSEGESRQQLWSSTERINLPGYGTYVDVYGGDESGRGEVIGGWWDGGGSKREEAW